MELWIIFVIRVKSKTIFTLEGDQRQLDIILVDLGFRDKDQVGFEVVREVLEVVNIAGTTLEISSKSTKRDKLWSINIYLNCRKLRV